jgi:hypothetical protein
MKTYVGVAALLPNYALNRGEWSVSRTYRFIPKERVPGTTLVGNSASPREVLEALKFVPPQNIVFTAELDLHSSIRLHGVIFD